ncbi:ABA 3 protein [Aspergillus neoniger CBS 115656]|uniref:ABA 3 protein n=1 Tax=Aspergillus neoniger (strain CBS 115656) TaxID=1448310 RepID=A0A318YJG9_ASPNB|nr:ABA 3 protein [Aspergillus neoniger CBS 115656]PYH33917.1 ABA 3 protein [Aspergillus neoniger CBS 115656]
MTIQNEWYYPDDIAHDLDGIDLPKETRDEALACAWEYSRSVIPHYTNWKRYIAFMGIIIMGIIAEFQGTMIDVTAGSKILNLDPDEVLAELFHGTPGHLDMAREYKTFLFITSQKVSHANSELSRRYVNALVSSPQQWFRMRDCDALARFTIASALACNDLLDIWFTDAQYDILCEIGDTMYDAVAFYKHRSEGETNSTFAYMPEDHRIEAFHRARQVLWAIDLAMAGTPGHLAVTNFLRSFGGPIHMMMRRYRFVEEDLTVGKSETKEVINQTRLNKKLWNRRSNEFMFRGLADYLDRANNQHCPECIYREVYGAQRDHCFGGVQLCEQCRFEWGHFLGTLPERAKRAFPDLNLRI